jgi:plasmid stabilization system protein ParE
MILEFHPEAEQELIEAAGFYQRELPGLGERLEDEVRRATDLLLAQPQIGSPVGADLRRFSLNRFPYTLYYSVSADVLRVEAVAHQSRRPGYWQSRSDR